MRALLMVLWLLLAGVTSAMAAVQVSIGINLPVYPQLVPVPGYPVYYAPSVPGNFFFYDGVYWVFYDDDWYMSSWYNGPWTIVAPAAVPLFVLRVPVRYYRAPPVYFRDWRRDRPPRWHEHWGPEWAERHRGWDHWNRRAAPRPAPLPTYQRQYSGDRYPREIRQQRELIGEHYRYRPHESVAREVVPEPSSRMKAPDRHEREATRPERSPRMEERDRQPFARDAEPRHRREEPMPMERRQMERRDMESRREQQMRERDMRERQAGGPRMEERGPRGQGGEQQAHGRKHPQQKEGGKNDQPER
ncbi:hypothetical protein [Azoarcus sp. KH32C]|uniref:hypothetical protein n=1 Tax=Azoarcus sp. KH32C TaxID=748247 RepID=UPI000345E15C|nr:hypothetical protein [Azoarcus sp. KH32C]